MRNVVSSAYNRVTNLDQTLANMQEKRVAKSFICACDLSRVQAFLYVWGCAHVQSHASHERTCCLQNQVPITFFLSTDIAFQECSQDSVDLCTYYYTNWTELQIFKSRHIKYLMTKYIQFYIIEKKIFSPCIILYLQNCS